MTPTICLLRTGDLLRHMMGTMVLVLSDPSSAECSTLDEYTFIEHSVEVLMIYEHTTIVTTLRSLDDQDLSQYYMLSRFQGGRASSCPPAV
mgnify:CR=1 FL=1